MARTRPWALAAGVIGLITLGMYLAVILGQGGNTVWEVAPWAGLMAVAALGALTGAVAANRSLAKAALLISTLVFAGLGFLALFSIGALFVVAAALTAVALVRVYREEAQTAI
ncbi:MAG: hypothetical protein ACE5MI_01240 [Acidimicrobiia bacterium]